MAEINLDELGPVDYVVVGFPADKADFSGAMADELKKLMDSGTVRVSIFSWSRRARMAPWRWPSCGARRK